MALSHDGLMGLHIHRCYFSEQKTVGVNCPNCAVSLELLVNHCKSAVCWTRRNSGLIQHGSSYILKTSIMLDYSLPNPPGAPESYHSQWYRKLPSDLEGSRDALPLLNSLLRSSIKLTRAVSIPRPGLKPEWGEFR